MMKYEYKIIKMDDIMTDQKDAWIRSYTGGKVYFFEPEKSEIDILDIFHALSLLCRFNGATKSFHSVAHHSVIVADNVYKETKCKKLAFMGLAHDFSEAFISDIPSPFKIHFPGFKEIEIKMEEWLAKKYGFQYPYDPIIKRHDLRCLATEMRDLMSIADLSELPEPYPEKIEPLSWQDAKKLIFQKFHFYSSRANDEKISNQGYSKARS